MQMEWKEACHKRRRSATIGRLQRKQHKVSPAICARRWHGRHRSGMQRAQRPHPQEPARVVPHLPRADTHRQPGAPVAMKSAGSASMSLTSDASSPGCSSTSSSRHRMYCASGAAARMPASRLQAGQRGAGGRGSAVRGRLVVAAPARHPAQPGPFLLVNLLARVLRIPCRLHAHGAAALHHAHSRWLIKTQVNTCC